MFTHLAIVDNPRYERANIVFNSKTAILSTQETEFENILSEAIAEVLEEYNG